MADDKANPGECPHPVRLRQFILGQLPGRDVDAVAEHLEQCPRCLQRVEADRFDDRLLAACRGPGTSIESPSSPRLQDLVNQVKQLAHPKVTAPAATVGSEVTPVIANETHPPECLLGRYRILRLLGSGGMGAVYLAEDSQLQRLVAVKIPRFAGTASDRARAQQRFLREGRLAAQVQHPNVCTVHDAGEDRGVPFVVMEFIPGSSLDAELTRRGRFEQAEAVRIAMQVARGLEAVHQRGIIHRDLKPANVLLNESGEALLGDFGLAKPGEREVPMTADGFTVGTPAYMAPEQLAVPVQVDARTDVYALGLVLYQMLTGRLPFEGTPQEQVWQRTAGGVPPPSRYREELDGTLEAIILRTLAPRPEDRYATAAILADILEGWRPTTSGPLSDPGPRRGRRWGALGPVLGIVVLLLGCAALAFRLLTVDPAPPSASGTPTQRSLPELPRIPEGPERTVAFPPPFRFVNRAVFDPILPVVVVSTPGNAILLIDAKTGDLLHTMSGHGPCELWALAVSPDGKRLLSGGDDGEVVLWDLEARTVLRRFAGHKRAIKRVSFTPTRDRVVSASDDGTVRTWNTRNGKEVDQFAFVPDGRGIQATHFSADGSRFLNGRADGTLEWFDVGEAKMLRSWQAHKDAVRCVAVSPDGTHALSGGDDDRLYLWDTGTGNKIADLGKLDRTPYVVTFVPGGRLALSGNPGGDVSLWDLEERRLVRTWKEHRFTLSSLVAAPSGQEFLSLSGHAELNLWRLAPR